MTLRKLLFLLVLVYPLFSQSQEIGRRYYFDKDNDSCTLEKAKYYHEYASIPEDSVHFIRWKKRVDGVIEAKEEFRRPMGNVPMKFDGVQEYYWESGLLELRTSRKYRADQRQFESDLHGLTQAYFENGVQRRNDFYQNGLLVEGHCWTSKGLDTAYYILEKKAHFPSVTGDIDRDFQRFIAENVAYPKKAKRMGVTGKVYISFIVEKDGRIEDVKVAKSAHKLLDEAALEAVRPMPHWEPAIWNGKPVRMSFTVPISFKLQ